MLEDDNAIDIKRKETNIEETQKGEEDEEFLEEETLFEEIVEKFDPNNPHNFIAVCPVQISPRAKFVTLKMPSHGLFTVF